MNTTFQKFALAMYITAAVLSLVVLINTFSKGEGVSWPNLFSTLLFGSIAYMTYQRQKDSKK